MHAPMWHVTCIHIWYNMTAHVAGDRHACPYVVTAHVTCYTCDIHTYVRTCMLHAMLKHVTCDDIYMTASLHSPSHTHTLTLVSESVIVFTALNLTMYITGDANGSALHVRRTDRAVMPLAPNSDTQLVSLSSGFGRQISLHAACWGHRCG